MVRGGQTVSATRFAGLTGVSRERLRTWERRYDFPRPQRVGAGPRRYELADADAVVAVRRASEEGVPLPRAIAEAQASTPAPDVSSAALAASAEQLPSPLMLLSGPAPVRVAYVNPALAAIDGAPHPGDELALAAPWVPGSQLERSAVALFTTTARTGDTSHPSWSPAGPEHVRALMYRLPAEPGQSPLVAVVELEHAGDRDTRLALARLLVEREQLDRQFEQHSRWLSSVSELAELFRQESGPALLQATSDTLVRWLPPIDVGVAVYMAGELALGSSSRGLLGPRMVTVTAHEDVAEVLREGRPAMLAPASAAAFGAPEDMHVLAVPVAVVGETLGALLLVLDEPREIGGEVGQLLSVLSAALGFLLLRDRLVAGARDARR
ncbi:MAG TPA: MerR family transcriptional regulator [Solirubrobacteraceae bacterium]|nr:MerR family transcriptional regulator [Solirubrobacteraceae bacterium]